MILLSVYRTIAGCVVASQVYEIVDRLCELRDKWPKSWGEFDANNIGVVTPYLDQVLNCRNTLAQLMSYAAVCIELCSPNVDRLN